MKPKTITGAAYRQILLEAATQIREHDTFVMVVEQSKVPTTLRAAAYYCEGTLIKIGRVQA